MEFDGISSDFQAEFCRKGISKYYLFEWLTFQDKRFAEMGHRYFLNQDTAMGITTDVDNSKISFDKSKAEISMEAVRNLFICKMPQFEIFYTYKFDVSSNNIVIPKNPELWDIGIVQNVLYDKFYYNYADGFVAQKEFTKPALDVAQVAHKPFLHGPVEMLAPNSRTSHKNPTSMIPVRRNWYASCGLGEEIISFSPCELKKNSEDLYVDVLDQPAFGTRLNHSLRGGVIKNAYRLLEFKNWLVAKSDKKIVVLGHMDSFSLVFWMDTTTTPELSIDTPGFSAGFYVQKGKVKEIMKKNSQTAVEITVYGGKSVIQPIVDGETANDRAYAWYKENELFP